MLGWIVVFLKNTSRPIKSRFLTICFLISPKALLEGLFKKGLKVDTFIGDKTLLQVACEWGSKRLIKYLLEKGAKSDIKSKSGKTAISIACERFINKNQKKFLLFHKKNDVDIIKNLVNSGGSIEDWDLYNILYMIVSCNDLGDKENELLELLRTKDIHVKSRFESFYYEEVVNFCLKLDRASIIDFFINKGLGDELSYLDLLFNAISKEKVNVVNIVIEKKPEMLSVKNRNGWTPLMVASLYKKLDILKLFIEKGADVNQINNGGETALICAYSNNDEDIKNELIKNGANLNYKYECEYGKTALMCAVYNGNEYIVNLILKQNDVDINLTDNLGKTALMYALENKENKGIIKQLLSREDIDINLTDNLGKTALMYALKNRQSESVIEQLLSRKDIDISLKDIYGKTALMYALENGQSENLINKLSNGDDMNISLNDYLMKTEFKNELENWQDYHVEKPILHKESVSENYNVKKKNNAHKNKIDDYKIDKARLIKAVKNGWGFTALELLNNYDGDLYEKDNFGNTMLHFAVNSGNLDIVKFFIEERKMNVDIKDGFGKSLLMCAIKGMKMAIINKKEDFFKVIKYLIEEGVDINAKDFTGKTTLEYLEDYKNKAEKKTDKEVKMIKEIEEIIKNSDKNISGDELHI